MQKGASAPPSWACVSLCFGYRFANERRNNDAQSPPQILRICIAPLKLSSSCPRIDLGYFAPPKFVPGTPGTMPPEMAFTENVSFDRAVADVPVPRTF